MDYCPVCGREYDEDYLNELFEQVKNVAYKIIELKGRTYYAISLGLTMVVESILRDETSVLTVSSLLQDHHGVSDVCLSVPTIINREGIREVLKLPLEKREIDHFHKSASIVKEIIKSLDI